MKKKLLIAIMAIAAAICSILSFAGCGKDSGDGGSVGNNNGDNVGTTEHVHSLTAVKEKEATCTVDGNTAYYSCGGCKKWFADENGNTEITDKSSVVKPKTGHTLTHVKRINATCFKDGNIAYYTCSACNVWFSDEKGTKEIAKSSVIIEKGHNFKNNVCTGCDIHISALSLKYTDKGEHYEVGGIETFTYDEIIIPSTYNGKPVTSIADRAFYECYRLKSIEIPESVISIGDCAFFDCSELTNMTIPESVTEIGAGAFEGCVSLKSITIPSGVTSVCDGTFMRCYALTSVTIPDSVTSIGNGSFHECYSLTSITIPDSVTSIGSYAFYFCEGLQSITLSNKLTSINYDTFHSCSSLASIIIPDSVTYIDEAAFSGCSSLTGITIPDGVTYIGFEAFAACSSLNSVDIPDSVTEIGNSVFDGCTGLTAVTIGKGLTSIGYGAFSYCDSLITLTVAEGNTKYYSQSNCIIETESKKLIAGCNSSIIPDGVNSIGDWAFCGCSGLESITIPDGVTAIGDRAFYGCSGLESITIPDSVTSIGERAFSNCGKLKYNEYDNALYLGNDNNPYIILIRAKDNNITSCKINEKTKFIHNDAFNSCRALREINFNGTKAEWEEIEKFGGWDSNTGNYKIHCTDGDISKS